ncbi:ankyrin repeat-containing protein At5g02620, partial [Ricinus communis]|uniref:ankyrin repeat-containing protein At5g02620 n=1 Tax=Ricinus communis TaxID=3988 RepID=UPI00201A6FEF
PYSSSSYRKKKDLLEDLTLKSNENLVHIASKHGKNTVVKELLALKPSLAEEPNKSCHYSIHLAAAQGYENVVVEHLNVDRDLCIKKDHNGWTPLHWATIKGRNGVLRLLLTPESIQSVTGKGHSCFHLAVEYNQYRAFKILLFYLELLTYEVMETMINLRESKGFAVLHRVTLQNQYQTLDMLLSSGMISRVLQINITDANELTPLDLFYVYSNEPDKEIGEMLNRAGAVRAGIQRPLSYKNTQNLPSGPGIFSGFYQTISSIPSEKLGSMVQFIAAFLIAAFQAVNNPFHSSSIGNKGGERLGFFYIGDVLRGSEEHSQLFIRW